MYNLWVLYTITSRGEGIHYTRDNSLEVIVNMCMLKIVVNCSTSELIVSIRRRACVTGVTLIRSGSRGYSEGGGAREDCGSVADAHVKHGGEGWKGISGRDQQTSRRGQKATGDMTNKHTHAHAHT